MIKNTAIVCYDFCIQLQNVEKGFVRSRYNENGEYVLIIEKGYSAHI